MNNYWLSWYHLRSYGHFELNWSYWVTGKGEDKYGSPVDSICAAVKADSEYNAKKIILASYDVEPGALTWRFCEKRGYGTDRFDCPTNVIVGVNKDGNYYIETEYTTILMPDVGMDTVEYINKLAEYINKLCGLNKWVIINEDVQL